MLNTKFKERRKFVKLASGLLVSPFASLASGNAFSADDKPPLRMLTIIDPYGLPLTTRSEIWASATGDYALTDDNLGTTLAPLKAYKDNMLIASGIRLESLHTTHDSRSHTHMASHTLCGSRRSSGTRSTAKTEHASLDVHIGNYLNNEYGLGRAYSHLHLSNGSQSNFTAMCFDEFGNQIRSIAGTESQASSIFIDDSNIDDLQFSNKLQQNVFGLIQKQVQALRGQLINANASTIMDAYQSSVDDLAAQLQISSENACGMPEYVSSIPVATTQSDTSTPYIFNNIQQAFACDLTSSLTYVIGGENNSGLRHAGLYDEDKYDDAELEHALGLNNHTLSHQTTDVANKATELIRTWQTELVANLLDNMSVTQDVDGNSILDNTVVFWTPVMSHNTHKADINPYLLIAGKNTNLKGGFHYDCDGSTNNDLLTTIAQGMGLPDDRFGGHGEDGIYIDALNNGPITKMLVS